MKKINWKTFERPCACCGKPVSLKGWRKALVWFGISFGGVTELQLMMALHDKGFFRHR